MLVNEEEEAGTTRVCRHEHKFPKDNKQTVVKTVTNPTSGPAVLNGRGKRCTQSLSGDAKVVRASEPEEVPKMPSWRKLDLVSSII